MKKQMAASPRQGQAASTKRRHVHYILQLSRFRRQLSPDFFGPLLTSCIAAADAAGRDRVVDDLLRVKSQWLKRGRA